MELIKSVLLIGFGYVLIIFINQLIIIEQTISPPPNLHPMISEEQKQELKNKLIEIG